MGGINVNNALNNLNMEAFRAIAGGDKSIGFVGMGADGRLEKVNAHRTFTGRNVMNVAEKTEDNEKLRYALFECLKSSVTANVQENMQKFIDSLAKQLGVKQSADDGGELRLEVSSQPLERRTVRALLHAVDTFNAGKLATSAPERLGKRDGAALEMLRQGNFAGDRLSLAELESLMAAVRKFGGDGGRGESVRVGIAGREVWLTREMDGRLVAEFDSGTAELTLPPFAARNLEQAILTNYDKFGDDGLRVLMDNLDKPPSSGELRTPAARHVREVCKRVVELKLGPMGLKEGDLVTVSPFHMHQFAQMAVSGRLTSIEQVRNQLQAMQDRGLTNSEEVLDLALKYEEAAEETQELVKTLGSGPVREPVSTVRAAFNLFTGGLGRLFGFSQPVKETTAADLKEMLADLICESDTVKADQLKGTPGARLAFSLSKHTTALAALLCDPPKMAAKLPDPYGGIALEMARQVRTTVDGDESTKKALGELKPGREGAVKAALDLALKLPPTKAMLASVETQLDAKVGAQFVKLQFMVGRSFEAMISGQEVDMAGLGAQVDEKLAELAAQPQNQGLDDKALMELAVAAVKAQFPAEPAAEPEADRVGDIRPKSGYKNLVTMMQENGVDPTAINREIPDPTGFYPENDERRGRPMLASDLRRAKERVAEERLELKKARLKASRELLDKICGGAAVDTKHGYGAFMLEVMKNYFTGMAPMDQRNMLAAGIRYMPDGASGVGMLGACLKGAGPIMQKMLQGLASTDCAPEFKAALKDMKGHLADIPDNIVKANLLDMVARSNGKVTKIEVVKKMGAASVGQAFLCTMTLSENDPSGQPKKVNVLVKMLRPDAEQRAQREKEVFIAASRKVKGMEITFRGQLESIMEELDLRIEGENTRNGQVYNPGAPDVKSAKLLDIIAPTKYTLVEECAPGVTVDDYLDEVDARMKAATKLFWKEVPKEPAETGPDGKPVMVRVFLDKMPFGNRDIERAEAILHARHQLAELYETTLIQQQRLISLADKWCQEGIYSSGFYHGDLHAGNIMVDTQFERDRNGKLVMGKNGGLTVIDFGNATRLDADQQQNVIRMMAAASVKDTNRFMEGFRNLMSREGRAKFDREPNRIHDTIHNLFNLGTQTDSGKRIAAVLMALQQMGYELPGPIFKFSQCQMRLQGTIDEMNATLGKIKAEMNEIYEISSGTEVSGRLSPIVSGIEALNRGGRGIVTTGIDQELRDLERRIDQRFHPERYPKLGTNGRPVAEEVMGEPLATENGKIVLPSYDNDTINNEVYRTPFDQAMFALMGLRSDMLDQLKDVVAELDQHNPTSGLKAQFEAVMQLRDQTLKPLEAETNNINDRYAETERQLREVDKKLKRLEKLESEIPLLKMYQKLVSEVGEEQALQLALDREDKFYKLPTTKEKLEYMNSEEGQLISAKSVYRDGYNGNVDIAEIEKEIAALKAENLNAQKDRLKGEIRQRNTLLADVNNRKTPVRKELAEAARTFAEIYQETMLNQLRRLTTEAHRDDRKFSNGALDDFCDAIGGVIASNKGSSLKKVGFLGVEVLWKTRKGQTQNPV